MRQIALKTRAGNVVVPIVLILIVAFLLGGGYWLIRGRAGSQGDNEQLITALVSESPFDHIVSEQGEIESSKNIEIECEVESRGGSGTAILWVIEEGTPVKEGEKLVELDSSQLEQDLKTQRIVVLNAQATVTTAEALVQQAEISREEYLEGTFKTEEKAIQSEVAVAEQELRKAQLSLASTQRLVAKGLVKSLQMEADEFAVANAKNQLEAATGRLKVLQQLTKQKFLVQYDSDIESAKAALEAEKSTLEEEQSKLNDIQTQIKACLVYAPSDGVVVHANRYSSRGGSAEFVVEAGAMVRERQAVIRLPDPAQMQVKAKINESRIALVSEGMPCTVNVSSLQDVELMGRVTKVNRYAEPSSFFTSSIKEYACFIEIIDPPGNIRTGMTAEVQIFVQQLPNAIQIPINGVYEHGGRTFTLLKKAGGGFDTKEVKIEATNDRMAALEEGLQAGDEIVVNLRQHLNLMQGLPELTSDSHVGLADAISKRTGKPTGSDVVPVADGPSGQRPKAGGPRGGAGGGGPGGGGPGGGGPGGGGGPPSPDVIVQTIFSENDTNKDGQLSADEVSGLESRRRDLAKSADKDGDGNVTRNEMTSYLKERFSGGGGGGRPGGG